MILAWPPVHWCRMQAHIKPPGCWSLPSTSVKLKLVSWQLLCKIRKGYNLKGQERWDFIYIFSFIRSLRLNWRWQSAVVAILSWSMRPCKKWPPPLILAFNLSWIFSAMCHFRMKSQQFVFKILENNGYYLFMKNLLIFYIEKEKKG